MAVGLRLHLQLLLEGLRAWLRRWVLRLLRLLMLLLLRLLRMLSRLRMLLWGDRVDTPDNCREHRSHLLALPVDVLRQLPLHALLPLAQLLDGFVLALQPLGEASLALRCLLGGEATPLLRRDCELLLMADYVLTDHRALRHRVCCALASGERDGLPPPQWLAAAAASSAAAAAAPAAARGRGEGDRRGGRCNGCSIAATTARVAIGKRMALESAEPGACLEHRQEEEAAELVREREEVERRRDRWLLGDGVSELREE